MHGNTIIKNAEYEQNVKFFAKENARITMIPPVHTGLPRDVSGTILEIHDNGDRYDITLDSG